MTLRPYVKRLGRRGGLLLLAAAPVNEMGDTVASVYAYAVGQMPPPPGANPAAVTDAFLRHALEDVQP